MCGRLEGYYWWCYQEYFNSYLVRTLFIHYLNPPLLLLSQSQHKSPTIQTPLLSLLFLNFPIWVLLAFNKLPFISFLLLHFSHLGFFFFCFFSLPLPLLRRFSQDLRQSSRLGRKGKVKRYTFSDQHEDTIFLQGADYDALDVNFKIYQLWKEDILTISFNSKDMKSALRSASFSGRDSKPAILKFCSFGERIVKGSLSFKRNEWNLFPLEAKILIKRPSIEKENSVGSVSFKGLRYIDLNEGTQKSPGLNSGGSDHEVADCTLFTEQQWWILLDFALLERSSVSFFDINKPESAFSRWLRARKRAAKIGKGLSKDKNARKLAFQHRLEAIDPHHRYGHNLEFYFKYWLGCETKQPFFYWLDLGEGKEVNLEQECPRLKLQQQCIKYLGPKESEAYEVIVENGKFFYKQSRQLLHTSEGPKDSKWIFVLSTSKALYVGQKKKGTFQHSSFLAGGATSAAGRLVVENGILKAVWPHSGHYCPKEENFQEFESFLKENNVDLTDVKKGPIGVDEEAWSNSIGIRFTRKVSFELNFTRGNISTEHESKIETSHACDGMPSNIAIAKMTNSFEETGGVRFSSSSTETKLAGKRKLKESLLLKQNYTPQKRNMLEDHEDSEEVNGRTNCIAEPKEADSFQSPEGPSCGNSAEVQLGGNEKLEQICTSDGYQIFENEICLRSGKRIKRHSYHKN